MYSADAIAARPASQRTKKWAVPRKPAYPLAQAVPPIRDETFRGELEPPSSALPTGRHRR